ncbi:thioesterase [Pseudonocardiaceae bacterium YIM PH 21723]|nr:thioesterase [Pseudonocardiaceae bacterium YIM PH 21723]
MESSKWLAIRRRLPAPVINLYCFAHAGGSPGEYVIWGDQLSGVQVCGIKLPGRAQRWKESPLRRMTELVDALITEVKFEQPFALFGHSLGGLVAFEVARALRDRGLPQPVELLISSSPPPPLPTRSTLVHTWPDDEFQAETERRWGELPERVRQDPKLLSLSLNTLRSDVEIFETYRHCPGDPLAVPITALVGDEERQELRTDAWREHTTGEFALHSFPGGHFYLRPQREQLLRVIAHSLSNKQIVRPAL